MKVFSVGNRANSGLWCLAEDEVQAAEVAKAFGHVRKVENARVEEVAFWTTRPDAIHFFEKQGVPGRLVLRIPNIGNLPPSAWDLLPDSHWVLVTKEGVMDANGNKGKTLKDLPEL